MSRYVGGYGPPDGPVIFVAEAPGSVEDQSGIPLDWRSGGRSASFLNDTIKEVTDNEFCLDDCYRTNVVKYHPPGDSLKRLSEIGHSIDEHIPQLWHEIGDLKTSTVVPLGNLALKAITGKGTGDYGIMQWRGSILKTQHLDKRAIPSIHPAGLLRAMGGEVSATKQKGGLNPRFKYVFKMDLYRAFEEAKKPRWDVPDPHLEVIRDDVNLERFFDRYRDEEICAVDIEVHRAIPICIGFAFNNWHGASVPLIDVMSWQNLDGIPESVLIRIWQIVARFLARKDIKIIGQNFKFDQERLWNVCKMRIENVWADIMMMAHALYPEFEKKLAFHQSLWTRFPFHKDDGKNFNPKKDNIVAFLKYNARDAVVTRELYDIFWKQAGDLQVPGFPNWRQEFVFDYQMQLHDFYRRMESVGMLTNLDRQSELVCEYVRKLLNIQDEMDQISGGEINYNSHPQIKNLLFLKQGEEKAYKNSFGLPKRQSSDEESLVALMQNVCKKLEHKRFIELLLDYRRIRKSLGTYLIAEPDYDGRMRTNVRICGTETGRSSTGILKPPVRPKKIGLGFQTLTKHGEIGPEIRSEFDADEGYVFVETDMSQAEARIVALLGNDRKTLDLFERGSDIHRLTASWIFGIPPEQITPELRFIGKTTRHAGNYGMGKNRLMYIVNTDAKKYNINISISEWKAGVILKKFHDFAPNIVNVFHAAIEQALTDNNRVLVNPFGRYRQFFGEWGHDLFKEAYAHLPQSTVPDHLRRACLRAQRRIQSENIDARFIIEGHDSITSLVKEDHIVGYLQIMEEELLKPIDFSRCTISRGSLVIPVEHKIGHNYRECKIKGCKGCKHLHDYKLKVAA